MPSSRKGFGSRLIHSLVSGQLEGNVVVSYETKGLACEIISPLSSSWQDACRI